MFVDRKQAYYQKLATLLSAEGFRMDPRLVRKEDRASTYRKVMVIPGTIASVLFPDVFLGPFWSMPGRITSGLLKLTAISGEELYEALEPIAPRFIILAAKYHRWNQDLHFVAVVNADQLTISEAFARARELHDCLKPLIKKWFKTQEVIINCIYVFFDESHCSQITRKLLKEGRERYDPKFGGVLYVWPIVINVPGRRIKYKRNLASMLEGKYWAVKKKVLRQVF